MAVADSCSSYVCKLSRYKSDTALSSALMEFSQPTHFLSLTSFLSARPRIKGSPIEEIAKLHFLSVSGKWRLVSRSLLWNCFMTCLLVYLSFCSWMVARETGLKWFSFIKMEEVHASKLSYVIASPAGKVLVLEVSFFFFFFCRQDSKRWPWNKDL